MWNQYNSSGTNQYDYNQDDDDFMDQFNSTNNTNDLNMNQSNDNNQQYTDNNINQYNDYTQNDNDDDFNQFLNKLKKDDNIDDNINNQFQQSDNNNDADDADFNAFLNKLKQNDDNSNTYDYQNPQNPQYMQYTQSNNDNIDNIHQFNPSYNDNDNNNVVNNNYKNIKPDMENVKWKVYLSDQNKWIYYDDNSNQLIENAYKTDAELCELKINGQNYEIRFKETPMNQYNLSTNVARKVQRITGNQSSVNNLLKKLYKSTSKLKSKLNKKYIWQWKDNEWKNYNKDISDEIEKLFLNNVQNDKILTKQFGSSYYEIRPFEQKQINKSTGFSREIRRVDVNNVKKQSNKGKFKKSKKKWKFGKYKKKQSDNVVSDNTNTDNVINVVDDNKNTDINPDKPNEWMMTCAPEKIITPVIPEQPREESRAFFSGLLVGGTYSANNTSVAYKVDTYSEYVGAGSYPQNTKAFPKSVATTFDGIAIDKYTRVIIWEKENFKGKILLDQVGPAVINNVKWKNMGASFPSYIATMTETYPDPKLQSNFPPNVRQWSCSDMHTWIHGSVKVCGSD